MKEQDKLNEGIYNFVFFFKFFSPLKLFLKFSKAKTRKSNIVHTGLGGSV